MTLGETSAARCGRLLTLRYVREGAERKPFSEKLLPATVTDRLSRSRYAVHTKTAFPFRLRPAITVKPTAHRALRRSPQAVDLARFEAVLLLARAFLSLSNKLVYQGAEFGQEVRAWVWNGLAQL
jgi:hypothetical protein